MGNCIHCGRPTGMLRKRHKECETKHQEGRLQVIDYVVAAAEAKSSVEQLESKLRELQSSHFITDEHVRPLLVKGWQSAVSKAFDDGVLSQEEEDGLDAVREKFGLTQSELDENGSFSQAVKGGVLRELMEGKIPERVSITGTLPFNLQKSERIIWVFTDVDYYEEKRRREYVGGSKGVSIRVAKGIYFRTSAFKGHPVERTETIHAGHGLLAVTNKHLYFGGGSGKDFRVQLDKIVSFEPFSDGIGIQRDAATAKPQIFVTGDGWFTYNVVQNAANL